MRLTVENIKKILNLNPGFKAITCYSGRNFSETRYYEIKNGMLTYRSKGKTSWADSRFDDYEIADMDQTRRFIRRYEHRLNTGE